MPLPFASLDPSFASLTATDTLTTSTWNPWRADIAQSDFNVLVLGTSISWGQGLDRHEKFAHLVALALQRSQVCARPAIVSFAHSGACIWDGPPKGLRKQALADFAPKSFDEALRIFKRDFPRLAPPARNRGEGAGECPSRPAHIWLQAAAAANLFKRANKRPDLILLDGGANDFGFMSIVGPPTPGQILTEINNIGSAMQNLIAAIAAHPHLSPRIVVSGYYQAFTSSFHVGNIPGASLHQRMRADILRLSPVLPTLTGFITPSLVDSWVDKAATFRRAFNGEPGWNGGILPAAVRAAGAGVFSDPGFGDDDGLLSPETKIWGPNKDGQPYDHAMDDRARDCLPRHADMATYEVHARASFGHPNPAGAELYARAICRAARTLR
jgi:hypothetical protein